jgi:hypothetical protein
MKWTHDAGNIADVVSCKDLSNKPFSLDSLIAKMDTWARQGETWREEIDSQLATMNKQLR